MRPFTAAVFGRLHKTTLYWSDNRCEEDLLALLDRTPGILRRGLEF